MKLVDLIDRYSANAYIIQDRGQGCSFPEKGQTQEWDEEALASWGDIELFPLKEKHVTEDGTVARFASAWLDVYGEFQQDQGNPYLVRILF